MGCEKDIPSGTKIIIERKESRVRGAARATMQNWIKKIEKGLLLVTAILLITAGGRAEASEERLTWFGDQLSENEKVFYDVLRDTDNLAAYAESGLDVSVGGQYVVTGVSYEELVDGSYEDRDDYQGMVNAVTNDVFRAMSAFEYDYPEVFWIGGAGCSYEMDLVEAGDSYMLGVSTVSLTMSDYYEGARTDIPAIEAAINEAVNEIAASFTGEEDYMAITRAVHDYVLALGSYTDDDLSFEPYHTISGILLDEFGHESVCEGYAKLLKILLDRFGVPAILVHGNAGGAHMWNMVALEDGSWYLVDATWDDQDIPVDVYLFATADTIGFDDVPISEERTTSGYIYEGTEPEFVYPALASGEKPAPKEEETPGGGDIVLPEIPTEDPNPFVDVDKSDWYYGAVMDVYKKGIMTGKEPTYFGAEESLSRAHFAAALYRRAGYPLYKYRQVFPDVNDGEWYTQCVLWAWDSQVILGYNDGHFGPADFLTREQLCTILWRYAWEEDGFDNSARASLDAYPDAERITPFALEAMEWCEAMGILNDRNGFICPWDEATRADCATMISRYLKAIGKDR